MPRYFIAIALLLAGIACSEDVPVAACENGTNAAREGNYEQAVKVISSCLASGLSDAVRADALKARAWSYSNLSQHAHAVDDQEKAFKLRPPSEYREFINYASYLRPVGRHQESLDAVLAAERLEGGKVSMMTQYHKGWSLLELGRYQEAVDAFTKGVPLQSDFAFVYWRRGLAYEGLGEKQRAERDFERCAELLIRQNDAAAAGELLPAMRDKLRQYGLDKRLSL